MHIAALCGSGLASPSPATNPSGQPETPRLASGFSRGLADIVKRAQAAAGAVAPSTVSVYTFVFNVLSWIAVAYCVVRGVPVIVEAIPALMAPQPSPTPREQAQ